jgi:hypothetical protein
LHLKLVNPNPEEIARDCFTNILNTKDLRTGNLRNLNSYLKWEESNETKLTVPQDAYKQFDAVVTSEEHPSISWS